MQTLSIGEIQKNISVLTNLKEPAEIVDMRKKTSIALILPLRTQSTISHLAGKYKENTPKEKKDFKEIRDEAMSLAVSQKFGK